MSVASFGGGGQASVALVLLLVVCQSSSAPASVISVEAQVGPSWSSSSSFEWLRSRIDEAQAKLSQAQQILNGLKLDLMGQWPTGGSPALNSIAFDGDTSTQSKEEAIFSQQNAPMQPTVGSHQDDDEHHVEWRPSLTADAESYGDELNDMFAEDPHYHDQHLQFGDLQEGPHTGHISQQVEANYQRQAPIVADQLSPVVMEVNRQVGERETTTPTNAIPQVASANIGLTTGDSGQPQHVPVQVDQHPQVIAAPVDPVHQPQLSESMLVSSASSDKHPQSADEVVVAVEEVKSKQPEQVVSYNESADAAGHAHELPNERPNHHDPQREHDTQHQQQHLSSVSPVPTDQVQPQPQQPPAAAYTAQPPSLSSSDQKDEPKSHYVAGSPHHDTIATAAAAAAAAAGYEPAVTSVPAAGQTRTANLIEPETRPVSDQVDPLAGWGTAEHNRLPDKMEALKNAAISAGQKAAGDTSKVWSDKWAFMNDWNEQQQQQQQQKQDQQGQQHRSLSSRLRQAKEKVLQGATSDLNQAGDQVTSGLAQSREQATSALSGAKEQAKSIVSNTKHSIRHQHQRRELSHAPAPANFMPAGYQAPVSRPIVSHANSYIVNNLMASPATAEQTFRVSEQPGASGKESRKHQGKFRRLTAKLNPLSRRKGEPSSQQATMATAGQASNWRQRASENMHEMMDRVKQNELVYGTINKLKTRALPPLKSGLNHGLGAANLLQDGVKNAYHRLRRTSRGSKSDENAANGGGPQVSVSQQGAQQASRFNLFEAEQHVPNDDDDDDDDDDDYKVEAEELPDHNGASMMAPPFERALPDMVGKYANIPAVTAPSGVPVATSSKSATSYSSSSSSWSSSWSGKRTVTPTG